AKDDAARQKVYREEYPSADGYALRFAALAKELHGDTAALDAWTWIVQRVQKPELVEPALEAIAADHMASPKVLDVVQAVNPFSPTPATEKFLRTVAAKSPHWEVKGHATFKLAAVLDALAATAEALGAKGDEGAADAETRAAMVSYYGKETCEELAALDPDEMRKEAEDRFEDVVKDFKAVKSAQGTLGLQAEAELFALRNLAIGKVAPEIVGQDVDGVTFKLSDYRGKVVVLDFWGFW